MNYLKLTQSKITIWVVNLVLLSVYIFPTGIVSNYSTLPIDKLIFSLGIMMMYLFSIKRMSKREILIILCILLFALYSKTIEFLLFATIPFLMKLLKNKRMIKAYLKNSNILYICLFATIIYTLIYIAGDGRDGRYAFSAIREINQSGLAIFCLASLLMVKDFRLAIFTYVFGLLTISRSYILAIFCVVFFKLPFIKSLLKKINLRMFSFTNITIITSLILYFLGVFYIYEYKAGKIFWGDEVSSRLFTLLDYSNYFRFVAVYFIVTMFLKYPLRMIVGIQETEFINHGANIANKLNIPYKSTPPHNLFFAHLRIYGIFAIIEVMCVSNILKKLVNIENFGIYIAIVLYSIFLGAGLYTYWLYLTVFAIIVFDKNIEVKKEKNT